MESGDSEEYQNKFQIRPKLKLGISGDSKSDTGSLESLDDPILTDVNSGVDDTEESSSKDAVILRANVVDTWWRGRHGERDREQILKNTELPESSLVNTRALLKEATTYELESFDKHALIIFNQKYFDYKSIRNGTEKDVDSLTTTFENFHFEVTLHNDLTKEEIFEEFEMFSKRDFTDYGCVAVAVLTHGEDNGRLMAADKSYYEIDLINKLMVDDFKKSTLVSKPKIFIIQACRGREASSGVQVLPSYPIRKDFDEENSKLNYFLPLEADLLILHSSHPGCASHRGDHYGSWFIQTLCKKIDTLSLTHDLESIMTEVKRAVAIDMEYGEYNPSTFETFVNKQMPVVTSTLIRKLYLKFADRGFEETYVDKSSTVQSRPCSCFLELFTYMSNCLRYFVAENPDDETAQDILDVVNTYEDKDEFNKSKYKMCIVMSNLLMEKVQNSPIYKYLHFVSVERKVTKSTYTKNEFLLSISLKSSFASLVICIFIGIFIFVLFNKM